MTTSDPRPQPHDDAPPDHAVLAFDRWDQRDRDRAPEPRAGAEDALLGALLARRALGTRRRVAVLAAAAVVLVGVGVGAGLALRPRAATAESPVPLAWAEHERKVLEAIDQGLGERVSWIASSGGEVVIGFTPRASDDERRVVFLELRDAEGHVLEAPRLVVPDGAEVAVDLPSMPSLSVRATKPSSNRVEIACAATFEDGAKIAATLPTVASGERVLVGEVRTGGRALALYAAAR